MRSIPLLALMLTAAVACAQTDPKKGETPAPVPREAVPGVRNPMGAARVSGQVFIGERAPDFELDAWTGKPIKLSRLRGDWVLLAFADRKEQIAELAEQDSVFASLGVSVVGVCREKAYVLEGYRRQTVAPFLMLADFSGEVADMYGLWDSVRGQTLPGFMVLDRTGVVRSAFIGQSIPPASVADIARFAVQGF